MTYYYSPLTGEIIHTTNPANWMGSTDLVPPIYNAVTQGLIFSNGAWGVVDVVATAVQVPSSVTMRQARLALLGAGLLDTVQAAVAAAPQVVQIEWEFAATVDRAWPTLTALQAAMGLTDAQIDALFVAAAAL